MQKPVFAVSICDFTRVLCLFSLRKFFSCFEKQFRSDFVKQDGNRLFTYYATATTTAGGMNLPAVKPRTFQDRPN